MSKPPPTPEKYKLEPGDAATIIEWWQQHPAQCKADLKAHRCPGALRHLGEGKVLYHLRQMEAYKAEVRARQPKRKKPR
jgi:hypothetical protein